MPQLPNAPQISIGTSSLQGNIYGKSQRVFSSGSPGILGLCMFTGYPNQAPADTVTALSSNSVIANKFFLSLCRTYMVYSSGVGNGAGGILVLGAGEDLTCSNCQLTAGNFTFVKYRDTSSLCSFSFYAVSIVDFAVKNNPLNLASSFAANNVFSFTYLGRLYNAGLASGCPPNNIYPNILDSGTSQIILPTTAFYTVTTAICNAYTGSSTFCLSIMQGQGQGAFFSLAGLPDASILLWDPDTSKIVTLVLPPTAYAQPPPMMPRRIPSSSQQRSDRCSV